MSLSPEELLARVCELRKSLGQEGSWEQRHVVDMTNDGVQLYPTPLVVMPGLADLYTESIDLAALLVAEHNALAQQVSMNARLVEELDAIKGPHCIQCGCEIDPSVCWCGDAARPYQGHAHAEDHPFVPYGCVCLKVDADWPTIASKLRALAWSKTALVQELATCLRIALGRLARSEEVDPELYRCLAALNEAKQSNGK